ncbi:TetR/AcrR family transcriptional regulator [Christensenellaceae bacterium OttesenSCG-928-M15]|nr:TetR/AcrR family transcriptional regulator [Christensenellaceae bacterium OttesenSCG-928-M15]
MEELSTREKLLKAGKEEFLLRGYKDASLREIGKKAGFTLGAFYGYYAGKEALFLDIVEEAAEELYERYLKVQTDFMNLPAEVQKQELNHVSDAGLHEMIELIYKDFDVFKLVFFRSAGTKYETYMQRLIDIEIESTHRFIDTLKSIGHSVEIDEDLIHILASAMFSGMMEVVDHDMDREKAISYISNFREFYEAGWNTLLGL